MAKLVLLLVAAAWAAVLIPPLLRSRIENRPNNSVSDFRDQLSSLQKAMPARRCRCAPSVAGWWARPSSVPLPPADPSTVGLPWPAGAHAHLGAAGRSARPDGPPRHSTDADALRSRSRTHGPAERRESPPT